MATLGQNERHCRHLLYNAEQNRPRRGPLTDAQVPRLQERTPSPPPPLAVHRHRGGLCVRGRRRLAAVRRPSRLGGHAGSRRVRQGPVHRARPRRPRPEQAQGRRRHPRRQGRHGRRHAGRRHAHHQHDRPRRRRALGHFSATSSNVFRREVQQGLALHRRHQHPHAGPRHRHRRGPHQHRPGHLHRRDRALRHGHRRRRRRQGERRGRRGGQVHRQRRPARRRVAGRHHHRRPRRQQARQEAHRVRRRPGARAQDDPARQDDRRSRASRCGSRPPTSSACRPSSSCWTARSASSPARRPRPSTPPRASRRASTSSSSRSRTRAATWSPASRSFTVDSTEHFGSATLWPGAKGKDVKALQSKLTNAGVYSGKKSGYYDDTTEKAVRKLQAKYGLEVDGIVGGNVLNALSGQIVVDIGDLKLYLYRDGKLVKSYSVATGSSAYPTPTGLLRGHLQDHEPHLVPAQLGLGQGRRAHPAGRREPARHPLDRHQRAGRRHPRHAGRLAPSAPTPPTAASACTSGRSRTSTSAS